MNFRRLFRYALSVPDLPRTVLAAHPRNPIAGGGLYLRFRRIAAKSNRASPIASPATSNRFRSGVPNPTLSASSRVLSQAFERREKPNRSAQAVPSLRHTPIQMRHNGPMADQPVDVWALADLCTPWCILVASTLRIAEHIAAGTAQIGDLAAAVHCDCKALHSVLGHLVGKGIFEEPEPGRFALNGAARSLLEPASHLGLDLDGFGGRMAHAWSTLLNYTRTGAPAYHEVFGRGFWEDLDAHPAIAAQFDDLIGPTGHGTPKPNFEIAGGWNTVRTVVDVGGGTGAMIAEILRAHPHLRGTLVDVPRAVARSREIFEAAGVSDRATAIGQSFFAPLPPGADLYLLRGVLNNWADKPSADLLRRCAEAASPAGRVVVLKSVGPDGARKDLTIDMILTGGRHRTVSELAALAREAGLELAAAGQQPSYFVTELRASTGS
jgi:hypothetical protein